MEKRWLSTVFALLCFFIIPAMLPAASFAKAVGSFSRVEGRVDMLREGKGSAILVKVGDSVSMGDIVRTKSDGKAEILFKDGTIVSVTPDTRMKIDEYAFNPDNSRKQGAIGLLRGKIRAIVSKAKVASIIPVSTGTSTFSVRTPTATAGVKGTDLFVFYNRGVTGVLFKEGLGFVYNTNMPDKIVNVSAGQITYILRPNTPPLSPRQATDVELRQHIRDATLEEPSKSEAKTEETATVDIASSTTTTETLAGDGGTSGYEIPAEGIADIVATETITGGGDTTEINTLLPVTETVSETLTTPPLSFMSEINDEAYSPSGEHGYFYTLFSGTESIWTSNQASSANVTWIGECLIPEAPFRVHLYSYNYNDNTYTTYDGGAYYGFMGGIDFNNTLDSAFYALYIDPSGNAGIVRGSLTGTIYPDLGMFEAEGGIYPIQIMPNVGVTAGNLYDSIVDEVFYSAGNTNFKLNGLQMGIGFGRNYSYGGEFLSIGSSGWGIWNARTAGSYSGISVSDNWSWSQIYNNGSMIFGTETTGTQWSGGKVVGSTVGYGADMASASTWISVGETIGTFDSTAQTFNALTMGAFLETDQFLQMTATAEGQAALQQLNIPFVEVGRASLTGTDGNLTINMNDVIFFAYSNGSAPNIWATNGVSGSYITDPAVTSVALSGNGLSAEFNVQQWTGGNWMSTVTGGGGTYSGTGTLNGSSVQFNGAAAGTYGSGTFSGTGAGVAK